MIARKLLLSLALALGLWATAKADILVGYDGPCEVYFQPEYGYYESCDGYPSFLGYQWGTWGWRYGWNGWPNGNWRRGNWHGGNNWHGGHGNWRGQNWHGGHGNWQGNRNVNRNVNRSNMNRNVNGINRGGMNRGTMNRGNVNRRHPQGGHPHGGHPHGH